MKTIDEIKTIARDYTGGPAVIMALRDALKWAEAYRQVAMDMADMASDVRDYREEVDSEAKRIVEEK